MLERAREESGRVLPAGPRRQRAGGLSVEPHHLLPQLRTPRCPSSANTGWPARTRKGWPWSRSIDRKNNRVDFKVVEGPDVIGNPTEATTSRGDTRCLLCRAGGEGRSCPMLAAMERTNGSQPTLTAVVSGSPKAKAASDTSPPIPNFDLAILYNMPSTEQTQLSSCKLSTDLPVPNLSSRRPDEPIDPATTWSPSWTHLASRRMGSSSSTPAN